jgi:hypothetical protein
VSEAEIASRLIAALTQHVAEKVGAESRLVTASFDVLARGDAARVDARVERKTRTLVFAAADAFSADGAHIAAASSVHRASES